MKYRLACMVFSTFLILSGISPALGVSTGAHLADTTDVTPVAEQGSGMPGWPVPHRPVPYHKPGRPSEAANYTSQVTQVDAAGVQSTVQLTGLDAMTADGIDPLAGNYRAVESAQIMVRADTYAADVDTLALQDIGSALAPDAVPADLAAGDLNGDGIDEQIAAWLDGSGHINLRVGAMPGTGRFTSAPAAVVHDDGTIDLLARGLDDSLYHSRFEGSAWSAWENDAGGLLLSGPAVTPRGVGQFDVFALGVSNEGDTPYARVYHARWAGEDWDRWDSSQIWQVVTSTNPWPALESVTPHLELPALAAAARGDQLDLFRLGPDHTLYHLGFDGAGWDSEWESLGGILRSAPAAVALGSDRMQVFASGVDGAVWHRTFSGGSWGQWGRLAMPAGILAASAPTAVSPPGVDQVFVYVRDSNGVLWRIQYDGAGWGSWHLVGEDRSIPSPNGRALQLDGLDDYVIRKPLQTENIETPIEELTAAFWMRSDDTNNAGTPLSYAVTGNDNEFLIYNYKDFDIYVKGESVGTGVSATDGAWHHIAVTWSSSDGEAKLYKDGNAVYTGTLAGGVVLQPGGSLVLGQDQDSVGGGFEADRAFKGAIDEVAVFTRTLSTEEISSTYTSGWDGLSGVVLGLHLDEPQATHGTPLADASGLGNHGTLHVLPFDPAPASAVGAAYHEGQTDLFVLTEDGNLQWRSGDSWSGMARPECVGHWVGTGHYDHDYGIKVDTGHFEGAGRELIAVSAVRRNDKRLLVALYDVQEGFRPGLRGHNWHEVGFADLDDDWDDGSHMGKFDIAVGDFWGAGYDVVLVASIYKPPEGWRWLVRKYACSDCDTLPDPVEIIEPTWMADGGRYEHIHIAMGDIDADPESEWAVVLGAMPEDGHESKRYVYNGYNQCKYSKDLDSLSDWAVPADVTMGNWVKEGPGEKQRDEIAFASGHNDDGETQLGVYRCDLDEITPTIKGMMGWTFPESTVGMNLNSGDLNRDLRDELVLVSHDEVHSNRILHVYQHDWVGEWVEEFTPPIPDYSMRLGPAIGDFRGDSLRLGPPTYRVQEKMTTPIMFLNMPPMHRDIVKNELGEEVEVKIIQDSAYAEYATVNAQDEHSTTTSKRDWSLSAGFDMSVGAGGHTVSTSFDNTYGKSFEKVESEIKGVELDDTITADVYDQVIYNATTHGVWEYPVLGVPEGEKTGPTTVSVVWPLDLKQDQDQNPLTEPASNKQYPKSCDENFYAPTHQRYNVWSYDPIGDPRFVDYAGEYLVHKQTSGGSSTTFAISEEQEERRTSSYHNQISAGLEYSYQNELSIPLIGKAYDFSFRAYVNGSYGWENISAFGTRLANETSVTLNLPSGEDESAYDIDAFLYEAKGGYWVLDYLTRPDPESGYWQYYNLPDPAFTLNWYGWPLETEPSLRYPCGREKQLFSHDVVIRPRYADIGDTVTIAATVRNFSAIAPGGPVKIRFYQGDPVEGHVLGETTITGLSRATGPQTASISILWTAAFGVGEQKIYAVIDPDDEIEEVHDDDDLINNNTAYGLLYVAGGDYLDPGLRESVPYQEIEVEFGPALSITAFLPTTNYATTFRYELVPTPIEGISVVGEPFRLDVYEGGQEKPPPSHEIEPTPAVIGVQATNADVTNLSLYRLGDHGWEDATCPDYEIYRFPAAGRMYVPVCELVYSEGSLKGTFALRGGVNVYLPLVMREA